MFSTFRAVAAFRRPWRASGGGRFGHTENHVVDGRLIVLAALVLASVLVGFVFRRPIAEAKSAVLAFDDASSQPQRD